MAKALLRHEDFAAVGKIFPAKTKPARFGSGESRALLSTGEKNMPKVNETIVIAAAQPKVFEFVSDAKRAPTFVPGLNRISNLSTATPQVGRTWEFEFNWFGLAVSGNSRWSR